MSSLGRVCEDREQDIMRKVSRESGWWAKLRKCQWIRVGLRSRGHRRVNST